VFQDHGPAAGARRRHGDPREVLDILLMLYFFLYLLREIWSSFKDSISKRALDNLLMLYFLYLLMRHRFFFCVFLQDGGGAVTAVATW
jgi:hypothetical protein